MEETCNIRVTKEIRKALKEIAPKEDMYLQELTEKILTEWIESYRAKQLSANPPTKPPET